MGEAGLREAGKESFRYQISHSVTQRQRAFRATDVLNNIKMPRISGAFLIRGISIPQKLKRHKISAIKTFSDFQIFIDGCQKQDCERGNVP